MESFVAARARPRVSKKRCDDEGVCQTLYVDERRVAVVNAAMPTPAVMEEIADRFSVLADPTRLRILYALSLQELCVCDLARILDRSMPATSQQLRQLRQLRLVVYRMEGKLAYYSLKPGWAKRLVTDAVKRAKYEPRP